jgi:hypothetical protein
MNLPKRSDPATAVRPLERAPRSNNATVPYELGVNARTLHLRVAAAFDDLAAVI